MITNSQTWATISNFFTTFRGAEQREFGYDNVACPVQINVDWSMANIKAVLHSFNNEELMDYVNRAFDIVSGKAVEGQLKKTVID